MFSDNIGAKDVRIKDERKHMVVTVDFQLTKGEGADQWVPRSDSAAYRDRIVWVVAGVDSVRYVATKLLRSERMIEGRAKKIAPPMPDDERTLLGEERNRRDAAQRELN